MYFILTSRSIFSDLNKSKSRAKRRKLIENVYYSLKFLFHFAKEKVGNFIRYR